MLKEIKGCVSPGILLAGVDSWLDWLRPGFLVLGRDGDDRGSVTVRGFAIDGRKTKSSGIVEMSILRVSKGLPMLTILSGMISPLALQVG